MKLTALDRLALITLMPKEGTFLKLETTKDIVLKVSFSAEERNKIKTNENGSVYWEEDIPLEVEFTSAEKALISELLVKLDKSEKLVQDYVGVYKLFVLTNKED